MVASKGTRRRSLGMGRKFNVQGLPPATGSEASARGLGLKFSSGFGIGTGSRVASTRWFGQDNFGAPGQRYHTVTIASAFPKVESMETISIPGLAFIHS